MSVMISGICDMVGTHIADYVYGRGIHPIGLSNKSTDHLFDIEQSCWGLIHRLAEQSCPALSWLYPADTRDINLVRTFNLCEVCQ